MNAINDLLSALKADLLDRRMLPVVAVVGTAFLAALAYAALGGGSSTSPESTGPAPAQASVAGLSVSPFVGEGAVAETTAGTSLQRTKATAHNPFKPLPEPKSSKPSSTASSSSSSSSSGSGSSGSGSSLSGSSSQGSSSEPAASSKPAPKPATETKHKLSYRVTVLFGEVPAGLGESDKLTPYENIAPKAPLPSSKQPLIVFKGAAQDGKFLVATFKLVSEPILHGSATCKPSASQCESFTMRVGQPEQLEYISSSGQPVIYELRVSSIDQISRVTRTRAAKLVSSEKTLVQSMSVETVPVALPAD